MKNISIDILRVTEAFPDRVAISSKFGDITYKELRLSVVSFAANMCERGVTQDSCVAVLARSSVFSIYALLAVGLIGASWVQANPRLRNQSVVKVSHIIYPNKIKTAVGRELVDAAGQVIRLGFDSSWFAAAPELIKKWKHLIKGNAKDSDVWMIASSSGTTGSPKLMEISYGNYWLRNKKAPLTHDFSPVVTANLFPALSGPWVSYNMRTLEQKGMLVLGGDPNFWVEKNVQKVFGSPKQFNVLINSGKLLEQHLPIAHIAGATLSSAFISKVLRNFKCIHNFYGGTEVGGIARNLIDQPVVDGRCVGKILEGNKVIIVDEQFNEAPQGQEGLIGVSNSIVVSGYINNAELTARCFRGGWYYSGDIGFINSEGEILITGRIDDVLNIGGVKLNAAVADDVISACSSVEEGLCFKNVIDGVDKLVALVVLKEGCSRSDAIAELAANFKDKLTRTYWVYGVYFVREIPHNKNGKPLRREALATAQDLELALLDFL